jgi:hypothetical protein
MLSKCIGILESGARPTYLSSRASEFVHAVAVVLLIINLLARERCYFEMHRDRNPLFSHVMMGAFLKFKRTHHVGDGTHSSCGSREDVGKSLKARAWS